MEITGLVFICVIFAICIAVVGFCCLKFCSSEDKYVLNRGGTKRSSVVPLSTDDCVVHGNQPNTQSLSTTSSKVGPLVKSCNQTMVRIEPYPKPEYNLTLPATSPGFVVGGISPYPPKPPPIGFGYPPETNVGTTSLWCPYPTNENLFRTPSPKPETYGMPCSLNSSYSSENTRSINTVPNSSETVTHSLEPSPPSYVEAMQEHQYQEDANSIKGRIPEYKLSR